VNDNRPTVKLETTFQAVAEFTIKVMAAKNKTTIPRFTIDDLPKAGKAVGKIAIPRVTVEDLSATIQKLIDKAEEAGIKPVTIRGTLTLY
jgi:hypothetical protein